MPRHPHLALAALLATALAATTPGTTPVHAAAHPPGAAASESEATTAAPTSVGDRLAGDARWRWPVDADRAVLRPFVAPAEPWSPGHRGVDVPAPAGARVVSPADGAVHFAGFVVDRPVLSIRHDGGLLSSFEPVESPLREGDRVLRGEPVGVVAPGHCEQPCLHVGVRLDGEYVSPMLLLGGMPRSVLLPTRTVP